MSTNTSAAPSKGRRRRRIADEGEDTGTEDPAAPSRPSECESEGEGPELGSELSEYESAHEESADQEEETEDGSDSETETGSETESGSETDTYTDEERIDQERQSGDGQEQPDDEKPDDDEDKKNPAYVPRRGAFYEHDYRQGDEGPEGVEETQPGQETDTPKPGKKLWQEDSKWSHDRYVDDLQAPKTREELIAIYGYDIRAADKPPEAPPTRPGTRNNRGGRRERNMQDFMPRMAVIDTTEDGADSVPNLGGEDDFIPYSNNNRGGSRGRGRRGGGPPSSSRGYDSRVDSYNSRNRQEGGIRGGRYSNEEGLRGGRYSNEEQGSNNGPRDAGRQSQDSRVGGGMSSRDFPSIQESTQRDGGKSYNNRRDGGYHEPDCSGDRWDGADDSRRSSHGRGGGGRFNNRGRGSSYGDGGAARGRHSSSQDTRYDKNSNWRELESTSSNNYGSQDVRSGRGGSNRGRWSRQDDHRRGNEDDWRASNKGSNNNSYLSRSDRPQQQRYRGDHNSRISDVNSYNSPTSGSYRPDHQTYEQQQPSYQKRQEFTNSSLKVDKDNSRRVGPPGLPLTGTGAAIGKDNNIDVSKNVVVSSSHDKGQREKVQTINVTITSTTTEKKSYAKERRAKGAPLLPEPPMLSGPLVESKQPGVPRLPPSTQFAPPHKHPAQPEVDQRVAGTSYSSQRHHQPITGRHFTDGAGSKLYNPALPPPPFYPRDQTSAGPPPPRHAAPQQQPPPLVTQDHARFTPALLPAASVPLQYPLPVSSGTLALASAPAAGGVNPALFQQTGQPPQGGQATTPAAVMAAPPFLSASMLYNGSPQGQAAPPPPFPLPLGAYTSPPPPPTQSAPAPQPTQQVPTQPPIKPYRGDITYYAPELQQPIRSPQKRPKAAIPIIDPQVIRAQKQKEKQAQQERNNRELKVEATPVPSSKTTEINVDSRPSSNQALEETSTTAIIAPSSKQTTETKADATREPSFKQEEMEVGSPLTQTVVDSSQDKTSAIASVEIPAATKSEDICNTTIADLKQEIVEVDSHSGQPSVDSNVKPASVVIEKIDKIKAVGSDLLAVASSLGSDPEAPSEYKTIVAVDSRPPLTIIQSIDQEVKENVVGGETDDTTEVVDTLSKMQVKSEDVQAET